MRELSDEELVTAYREQHPSPAANSLLNELFGRYHSRVAAWCFRFTGDRDTASDLAQDIFLRAFRSLASFRGDAKFSTWLFTIARNHCMNERKASAARPEYGAQDDGSLDIEDRASSDALASLLHEESLEWMRGLIAGTLDETEKIVMVLHYAHEMRLDAVTRLLGLTNASGAKAYVVSAKRKLSGAVERWRNRKRSGAIEGGI